MCREGGVCWRRVGVMARSKGLGRGLKVVWFRRGDNVDDMGAEAPFETPF
jgi:hypothetical protein